MSSVKLSFNLSGKVSDASVEVNTVNELGIGNYFGRYILAIGTNYQNIYSSGTVTVPEFLVIKNITKGSKLYISLNNGVSSMCILNYDEFILIHTAILFWETNKFMVKADKIIQIEYVVANSVL